MFLQHVDRITERLDNPQIIHQPTARADRTDSIAALPAFKAALQKAATHAVRVIAGINDKGRLVGAITCHKQAEINRITDMLTRFSDVSKYETKTNPHDEDHHGSHHVHVKVKTPDGKTVEGEVMVMTARLFHHGEHHATRTTVPRIVLKALATSPKG